MHMCITATVRRTNSLRAPCSTCAPWPSTCCSGRGCWLPVNGAWDSMCRPASANRICICTYWQAPSADRAAANALDAAPHGIVASDATVYASSTRRGAVGTAASRHNWRAWKPMRPDMPLITATRLHCRPPRSTCAMDEVSDPPCQLSGGPCSVKAPAHRSVTASALSQLLVSGRVAKGRDRPSPNDDGPLRQQQLCTVWACPPPQRMANRAVRPSVRR